MCSEGAIAIFLKVVSSNQIDFAANISFWGDMTHDQIGNFDIDSYIIERSVFSFMEKYKSILVYQRFQLKIKKSR